MSTATYTCDMGYELFGSPNVECNELGHWNGTVNCTIRGKEYIWTLKSYNES